MSHRCMNCGAEYEEGDEALIEGCEDCGSTLFLYEKEGEEEFDREELEEEKKSVMDELDKFLRDVKSRVKPGGEFEFDLQSITVQEDGVYEIDVRKLLEEIPLIVEIKDGEYRLHLASVFSEGKEKGLRLQDLDLDEEVKERIRENSSA
ncbi:MAG: Zn-ribbon containing protein [Candidatus Nanohaloarchaea archaeon]|nr:Zn-ribbon containing protein [Candidatus Nanohaloarchaea archaeon]